MFEPTVLERTRVPESALSRLETRDVGLWIKTLPTDQLGALREFIALPWRFVVLENVTSDFLRELDVSATSDTAMIRKRGFLQVIDSDPSRIELPQRCLPVYLINGRATEAKTGFDAMLRKLNMLEAVRRSGPREMLVLNGDFDTIPAEIQELWTAGFRCELTVVSTSVLLQASLIDWAKGIAGGLYATLVNQAEIETIVDVVARYHRTYPDDRTIIRVRDARGGLQKVDITEIDDPERPILEPYKIIQERDLASISPEELTLDEFVGFFRDPSASWKAYAAGLPWIRDLSGREGVLQLLRKLDTVGPDENRIAYITAESGSGGTTLARTIAWDCARLGYPVLIANQIPFIPDSLRLVNFLNLARTAAEGMAHAEPTAETKRLEPESSVKRYEAPWLIVFDVLHWQYRDGDLERFRSDLQKSGRPACILVVSGPSVSIAYHVSSSFRRVAELNHVIDDEEARALGTHLNRFLRPHGKQREQWQWDSFYKDHTVRMIEGAAAFWITLSFWIQGHYDLSESVQEWMYRLFKNNPADKTVKLAVLHVAALSSERIPIPESLLPHATGKWPISQLLSDAQASLAALGLTRISSDGHSFWGLVHDILGRFLINALFYDYSEREAFGFSHAQDPEHLRFLILKTISQDPRLGEVALKATGEEFATTVFKVDREHGHAAFASFWRDVLSALDSMPRPLRDTSRVFRHHVAISRRRIATLDERIYGVNDQDRLTLLNAAVADLVYALNYIDYVQGSESDLNLYNSLARAYQDLETIESAQGAPKSRLVELRTLANDATRRAYDESPNNSFTIETFVKNLLLSARDAETPAVDQCIEALGLLYSALTSNETAYRAAELEKLADQAVKLLFRQVPLDVPNPNPKSPLEVLVEAWRLLASERSEGAWGLTEVSAESRSRALEALAVPQAKGNMQVIRLRYDLTCLNSPRSFKAQLELVEQLQASSYKVTPQLTLEYAILLYQCDRAFEGDKIFKNLRNLWRDSEHFVQVPERLRWLWTIDGQQLQTVHAITGSDYGNRTLARVDEFRSSLVPFRPEEHGISTLRAGTRFRCHVSFGHNGPFLRPVTAGPLSSGGGRG
jgi:hypothetical protein